MSLSLWFRSPRYLLRLFRSIMLVLAASLSSLNWRLLRQDRALESQRSFPRACAAATLRSNPPRCRAVPGNCPTVKASSVELFQGRVCISYDADIPQPIRDKPARQWHLVGLVA